MAARAMCTACRLDPRVQTSQSVFGGARRNFSQVSASASNSNARWLRASSSQTIRSQLRPSIVRASPTLALSLAPSRRHNSSNSFAHDLTPAVAPPNATGNSLEPILPQEWTAATPPSTTELGFSQLYGLDFGWGPSTCVQWIFEHVHVLGGLPWWASIVSTAAIVRFGMLPLLMKSSDQTAKLSNLAPVLAPIQQQMKAAVNEGKKREATRFRQQMVKAQREAGISFGWSIVPVVVQMPAGFALWRVTRRMADVPIPGLEDGGILWFHNLAVADPIFVLPIACAYLQYRAAKLGLDINPNNAMFKDSFMRKLFLFGLPSLSMVFIGFAPAAVQLNFVVTAAAALITNLVINNPTVRRMVGVATINRTAATTGPTTPTNTLNVSANAYHPEAIEKARANADQAAAAATRDGSFTGRALNFAKTTSAKMENAMEGFGSNPKSKAAAQKRRDERERAWEAKKKAEMGSRQSERR